MESSAQRDDNSSVHLPVIDLGGLRSGDRAAREKIVRELGAATEAWGFFQVVNHSVTDDLQDRMTEQSRQFFDLPLDIKKDAEISGPNPRLFGYKGFKGTSDTLGEGKKESVVVKEALAYSFSPSSSLEGLTARIWPGGNSTFSNTVQEYGLSVKSLGNQLFELLAESLGVKRDFYSRHFNDTAEDSCTWRLHHFPPNPLPISVLKTPPHTDPSVLTLLKQDVGGLQVMKPGGSNWINVEPLPGSYVVNVGNILEAWSNGRFPSGEHRVAIKEDTERFSMMVFVEAGPSLHIETPPELVDNEHPSRFVPFIAGDFRVNFEKTKKYGDISKGQALDYLRRPAV